MPPTSRRQAQCWQEKTDRVFDAMRKYVRQRERMAPMAFVGRDGILKDLMDAVDTTASENDPQGMTRIVQGVPGAGKTALCNEFIHKHQSQKIPWLDKEGRQHQAALFCVNLPPADINVPPLTFVQGLHERWVDHCRSLEAGVTKASRAHLNRLADIARLWLKISTEHESVEKSKALTKDSPLGDCISAYSHDYWGKSKMVVAVCIDEAQDLPVTDRAKAALSAMHNGTHPAKIVPLLFGLPNTLTHVSDQEHGMGLSRLNEAFVHDICLLDPGQARQIIDGTFDSLGLQWENTDWSGYLRRREFEMRHWGAWRSKIADAIVDGACDFPQHVTLGLHTACEALIERRRTLAPQGLDDLVKDVRAKHQQRKTAYYQQRLDSIIQYGAAFGAICKQALGRSYGSVGDDEAMAAIESAAQARGRPLTADQSEAILKQALDKGILRKMRDGDIGPPAIPSMSTHLEMLLQSALDKGRSHAVRACQAIGLSTSPMETPAPLGEYADSP